MTTVPAMSMFPPPPYVPGTSSASPSATGTLTTAAAAAALLPTAHATDLTSAWKAYGKLMRICRKLVKSETLDIYIISQKCNV